MLAMGYASAAAASVIDTRKSVFGPMGAMEEASGGGGRAAGPRGADAAAAVLQLADRQLVRIGVGQLDVADGAGGLVHGGGDALIALAAEAHGPVDRRAFADL